jgi:hypothetical protein
MSEGFDSKGFYATVQEAQHLLKENNAWRENYKRYAEKLTENLAFIAKKCGNFNEWAPLHFFINTTAAMSSTRKLVLDVRYMGQNVAKLTCDKDDRVTISTRGEDLESNNQRHFGCSIALNEVDWASKDAAKFRKYFKDEKPKRKGNHEVKIQSMLLTEFSKTGRTKLLRGIQPVKFAKIRFPMPTALSASDHGKLEYGKGSSGGGSIDILARVGKSPNVCLCIIEVKDENKKSEPPKDALKQAIAYAVFIRDLLRSDAGPLWWKLFGFSGKIPVKGKLKLYASCAMPVGKGELDDKSFGGKSLKIDGDTIECHYVYFEMPEDKSSLLKIESSLPQIP